MKLFSIILLIVTSVIASEIKEYDITEIKAVFNDSTPSFGKFKVIVSIKNNTNKPNNKLMIACYYCGFTKPGVYFKNEPMIMKEYKLIEIKGNEQKEITFNKDFQTYHPEVLGELIVSIVGTGIIKSQSLKTNFHPNSDD